ncbi:MAG: NAD-dependent epimerase/dehydratase family protein [Bacteroidales bacterium]|nr:NAD-dependent epimerase/dehydratase family protein [Bacteroidales bacterium]
MTKLLITGSSGFVGSNVYDLFHQDFELYGLDISTNGRFPQERIFSWENLDRLPEVDAIIHLAGKAHDTSDTTEEAEYFEVNLGLTQKIVDHFLRSKAEKIIFFSSVKAVADSVEGVLTEEAASEPKTAYGKSKLAAEEYLRENMEEWKDGRMEKNGKSVYILRPCMIHGPGNKGNLNLLYKVVQKGIPWPLGAFDNQRSFASISNVGYIVRRLIEEPIPSGIYQIADDEPLSTNELIRLTAKSLDRKAGIWNLPKGFISTLARLGDVLRLPLNSERLKKLTESYVVSNEKIKSVLKIENMPVSSSEGMMETLKSFSNKI